MVSINRNQEISSRKCVCAIFFWTFRHILGLLVQPFELSQSPWPASAAAVHSARTPDPFYGLRQTDLTMYFLIAASPARQPCAPYRVISHIERRAPVCPPRPAGRSSLHGGTFRLDLFGGAHLVCARARCILMHDVCPSFRNFQCLFFLLLCFFFFRV